MSLALRSSVIQNNEEEGNIEERLAEWSETSRQIVKGTSLIQDAIRRIEKDAEEQKQKTEE